MKVYYCGTFPNIYLNRACIHTHTVRSDSDVSAYQLNLLTLSKIRERSGVGRGAARVTSPPEIEFKKIKMSQNRSFILAKIL